MIFSPHDMWMLGRAAERPYYPAGSEIINELQPLALHDLTAGNDYGYLAEWDDCWSVHILGSDDPFDWVENIFGWLGRTDTGAAAGYSRPAARLARQAMEHISDNRPIFLEGHSRGGAIASDMALRLARIGFDVLRVVTFGSPPPGGRKWWDNMADERLIVDRYEIKGDIVCNTPPWGRQYGRPIELESKKWGWKSKHLDYGNVLSTEKIYRV